MDKPSARAGNFGHKIIDEKDLASVQCASVALSQIGDIPRTGLDVYQTIGIHRMPGGRYAFVRVSSDSAGTRSITIGEPQRLGIAARVLYYEAERLVRAISGAK